ncbi:MAG: DNA starvation/stationary phase protection protein [Bacteroidia bacterium]|nr:DNA starvation/stationary phase protection protein [Bacteroidia bacterium]MCC6768050.1 DNA starvation/stationary phase protection protein [Bacteroidia bacterium]
MSKNEKKSGKGKLPASGNIGLNAQDCKALSGSLNTLLANYQMFYQNTRGFHWNIKGENFFELHLKFEELYSDLQVKIDEIAERILTLGHTPVHSFEEFQALSKIKSIRNCHNGKVAIAHILDAFGIILAKQRELLVQSGEAHDEGTNALMSDYISAQEKLVWMYSAYLG